MSAAVLPVLHGASVGLRPLEPDDLDTLYAWESDTAAWLTSGMSAPFSRQLLRQYLTTYDADIYRTGQVRLMVCLTADNTPVGMLDIFNVDALNSRAEVGIYMASCFRTCGYGLDALGVAADYVCNHVGLHQLYAHVAADNAAALALFKAADYCVVARLAHWLRRRGTYCDAIMLQKVF